MWVGAAWTRLVYRAIRLSHWSESMKCTLTPSASCSLMSWYVRFPALSGNIGLQICLDVIIRIPVCACLVQRFCGIVLVRVETMVIVAGFCVVIRISFGVAIWSVFPNIVISWCEDWSCPSIVMVFCNFSGFKWGFDTSDRSSWILVSSALGMFSSIDVVDVSGCVPRRLFWIVVSSNLSFELLSEDPIVILGDIRVWRAAKLRVGGFFLPYLLWRKWRKLNVPWLLSRKFYQSAFLKVILGGFRLWNWGDPMMMMMQNIMVSSV